MNLVDRIMKEGKIITQNDFVLINGVKIHGTYSIELEYPIVKLYDCNGIEIADVYYHDISIIEIVGEND